MLHVLCLSRQSETPGQHVPHFVNISPVHLCFGSSLRQHIQQNLHLQVQQVVLLA